MFRQGTPKALHPAQIPWARVWHNGMWLNYLYDAGMNTRPNTALHFARYHSFRQLFSEIYFTVFKFLEHCTEQQEIVTGRTREAQLSTAQTSKPKNLLLLIFYFGNVNLWTSNKVMAFSWWVGVLASLQYSAINTVLALFIHPKVITDFWEVHVRSSGSF